MGKNTVKVSQTVFTATQSELDAFDNSLNGGLINHDGGDYIVSAFAKADGAMLSDNARFAVQVKVVYYQGAGNTDFPMIYNFTFAPLCDGWQFVYGRVPTLLTNTTFINDTCIKSLEVSLIFSSQFGREALFDNVSLVYATGSKVKSYSYHSNGLLKSAKPVNI